MHVKRNNNMENRRSCTCTAPVNIAVVKYWGKRNEELVLPVNSSVSVTLDQAHLRAKTTVCASKELQEDRLWLNGREESMHTKRIQGLLKAIRQRAHDQGNTGDLLSWKLHICSENNFPTAAGLASSAAGYACLAYTLAQLYSVTGDISDIARRGSGSACRSVYGGFVVWNQGTREDGADSVARQLFPESHWPQLRVLICVVSDHKKAVGSSEGMQATVRTSQLMQQRIHCVPDRIEEIKQSIKSHDFQTFAELTMKDSNQLHAICLDTYPPISYQTDVSRHIMALVHAYNKYHGENKVAYTFDAGPNACLYMLEEEVERVISLVTHFYPPGDTTSFLKGLPASPSSVEQECLSALNLPVLDDALQYLILTKPGPGPQVCPKESDSLLDDHGLPKCVVAEKRKSDCLS